MTEPASDLLATPEALTRALRGAPIDSMLAEDLLRRASAVVRNHCGWHITRQTDHEFVVDGPGTRTLFLPTLALTAVKSVTENGDAVALADVDWSTAGMLERRGCRCWTSRLSGVRVVVDHGVAEPPEDVGAVVISVAARAYANPTGQKAASAGVVRDEFDPDPLTKAEKVLLVPWRIR